MTLRWDFLLNQIGDLERCRFPLIRSRPGGMVAKRTEKTIHFNVRLFLIVIAMTRAHPLRIGIALIGEPSTPFLL